MSTLYLNAVAAGRLTDMDPLWLGVLIAIPLVTGAVCSWRGRPWWFGAMVVSLVLVGEKQLGQQGIVVRFGGIAAAAALVWVGAEIHRRLLHRGAADPGREQDLEHAEAD